MALGGAVCRRLCAPDPRSAQRGLPLALFAAALGVITLKDLQNHWLFEGLVDAGRFADPWVRMPFQGMAPGAFASAVVIGGQLAAMVAAVLLMARQWVRPAAFALAGAYAYVFLADKVRYTNNVYLLVCLLLVAGFAGARAGAGERGVVPAWPGWLGRVLVSFVYLTAAAVKLDEAWLSGWLMEQSLRHYHYLYATKVGFYHPGLFRFVAIATVCVEVALGVLPWVRRRWAWPLAAALALGFHGLIELMLPVRCFSYLMIASFLLSMPPEHAARARRWLRTAIVSRPWARRPMTRGLVAMGAGVAAASALNLVTAVGLGAYPLVRGVGVFTALAFVIAAGMVVSLGARGRVARRRARAGAWALLLVGAFAALQLVLVVKPLFGFTNAFAWRMFTEDVKLQVELFVRQDGEDTLERRALADEGAAGIWSDRGYLHHWSSWPEQRALLESYARWLRMRDPSIAQVELRALVKVNDDPWRAERIER